MRWLLLALFALVAVACEALPPALIVPIQIQDDVRRGVLITAAEAPQSEPPAVATSGDRLLAFWIGSDERGVHHDARIIHGNTLNEVVTLPLPPVHPFSQKAVAADGGAALLFWLDRNNDNETALFAARITPDLRVERGPIEVSDEPVYQYAVIPDGAGGAWAVWSGGSPAEPALYARQIDEEGRPLQAEPMQSRGAFPALTYDAEGRIWAIWLANGQLRRGQFNAGRIVGDAEAVTSAIQLNTGDRLTELTAGSDGIYGYVFWNITRANGNAETWILVGSFNDPFWAQPRRFTGTDGGTIRFAVPLDQPASPLPAAVIADGGTSIVYLQDGRVLAEFPLVSPASALHPPVLTAYANGDLVLGWSEPDGATADLRLLTLSSAR